MFSCYTITEKNKIRKGIPIKASLCETCFRPDIKGNQDTREYQIDNCGSERLLLLCEIDTSNKVLHYRKADSSKKINIEGMLILINWKSDIAGGCIVSNLDSLVQNGTVEVLETNKVFEGTTLDFTDNNYTTTYLILVKSDCIIKFYSEIHISSHKKYMGNQLINLNVYTSANVLNITSNKVK